MNDEKRMILEMLSNKNITVDDAERLLAAIPEEHENTAVANTFSEPKMQPKRIKIVVTDNNTYRDKINIRVPFSLIKAGLKIGKASMALGSKYSSDDESRQVLELLKEINVDEILNSLDDGDITLPYTMVDIDDTEGGKNDHIEIVLE